MQEFFGLEAGETGKVAYQEESGIDKRQESALCFDRYVSLLEGMWRGIELYLFSHRKVVPFRALFWCALIHLPNQTVKVL